MSRNGLKGGSSGVTKPLPALYVYKSELHLFYFSFDDMPIGTHLQILLLLHGIYKEEPFENCFLH